MWIFCVAVSFWSTVFFLQHQLALALLLDWSDSRYPGISSLPLFFQQSLILRHMHWGIRSMNTDPGVSVHMGRPMSWRFLHCSYIKANVVSRNWHCPVAHSPNTTGAVSAQLGTFRIWKLHSLNWGTGGLQSWFLPLLILLQTCMTLSPRRWHTSRLFRDSSRGFSKNQLAQYISKSRLCRTGGSPRMAAIIHHMLAPWAAHGFMTLLPNVTSRWGQCFPKAVCTLEHSLATPICKHGAKNPFTS